MRLAAEGVYINLILPSDNVHTDLCNSSIQTICIISFKTHTHTVDPSPYISYIQCIIQHCVCVDNACLSCHSKNTCLSLHLVCSQVAVLAHGIHGNETPFTFGATVPRMTFHWTVTNMDVFSLASVYEKVLVSVVRVYGACLSSCTNSTGGGVCVMSLPQLLTCLTLFC